MKHQSWRRRRGRPKPARQEALDEEERRLFEDAVAALDRRGGRPDRTPGPGLRDETRHAGRRHGPRFDKLVARDAVEPEAVLDLHGLDRETAAQRLRGWLSGLVGGPRVVLIVHGKGRGVLARTVGAELSAHPAVAESMVAPPRLGGDGARLVRLRRRGRGGDR